MFLQNEKLRKMCKKLKKIRKLYIYLNFTCFISSQDINMMQYFFVLYVLKIMAYAITRNNVFPNFISSVNIYRIVLSLLKTLIDSLLIKKNLKYLLICPPIVLNKLNKKQTILKKFFVKALQKIKQIKSKNFDMGVFFF